MRACVPAPVTIPGYEVGPPLEQRGVAVVYQARQVVVGRDVAVKVLPAVDLDDADQQRFERDHALGQLSWQPIVVVVHDAGRTQEGQPFIASRHRSWRSTPTSNPPTSTRCADTVSSWSCSRTSVTSS
jgi:serine/threonine protein kinase